MRRHPVITYFLLAYALSWAWEVPLALQGETVRAADGWPTHLPALLGPALAAVVVTGAVDGRRGLRGLVRRLCRWRVGWWWTAVAGTLSLTLLGVLVPLATGAAVPSFAAFTGYTGIGAITPLGVVLVALLVNGFGEETGWRGFAVDRLLPEHGLRSTSVVVGLAWAGWHLPLFWLAEGFRSMGLLAAGWLVGLLAGSVVLTFLYQQGRRSIPLVAAWHTAFNLTSGTAATGAVVGTAASVLVICWALWILRSSARDRGDHRDLGAVGGRGGQPVEEAHVLVADVHVDEPPEVAGLVQDPRLDAGVAALEVVEHRTQGVALGGHLGGAAGVGAQDRGDADVDAHGGSFGVG